MYMFMYMQAHYDHVCTTSYGFRDRLWRIDHLVV